MFRSINLNRKILLIIGTFLVLIIIGISAFLVYQRQFNAGAANIGCGTVPAGMTPVDMSGSNVFPITQSSDMTLADNTLYCNGGNINIASFQTIRFGVNTQVRAASITVSGKITTTDANHSITTHDQNTVNPINETTYIQSIARVAIIANSVTINSGGSLDAMGKGYYIFYGPGGCNGGGASHGGEGTTSPCTNAVPYGSNTRPITLGSGSNNYPGGGAVYLETENLVNNGDIDVRGENAGGATYYSGAGGSIWVKGCNISGSGNFYAGGVYGAGGRIAIYHCPTSASWYSGASGQFSVAGYPAYGGDGTLYAYNSALSITSVSPNKGSIQGGTTITITGNGFTAGTPTVMIDTNPCSSVNVASATSLSCVTPPGSSLGAKNVKITIDGYDINYESFTYTPLAKATTANANIVESGNVEIVDADNTNTVYNNSNPNTLNKFVKVKVTNIKEYPSLTTNLSDTPAISRVKIFRQSGGSPNYPNDPLATVLDQNNQSQTSNGFECPIVAGNCITTLKFRVNESGNYYAVYEVEGR
jgi:hypothetical protein